MPRIDFHTHTTLSDGLLLPAALVYEAYQRGHSALAITDHVDASNLEDVVNSLVKVAKEQGKSLPIKLLPGVEISYVAPELIEKYAQQARKLGAKIIIVHGETPIEPAVPKGTNRAALKLKGLVDILAHPGSLTEEEALLAKVNKIYLELSARQRYINENRHVAKLAQQFGAKLLVNTDAHSEQDLISQEQALIIAQKAGLNKEQAQQAVENNPQELLKRT